MKLHIKLLIALAMLLTFSIKAQATDFYSLQLQLMIDTSASIDATQFQQQLNGYVGAFNDPGIQSLIEQLPNGMIASVGYFSTTATPGVPTDPGGILNNAVIDWTSISSAGDASAFATAISMLPATDDDGSGVGKTNIADAIQFGRNNITGSGIAASKRIIDVSTDGIQNIGLDGVSVIPSCEMMNFACINDGGAIIKNQSNLAAADDITVNAIFIGGADDLPVPPALLGDYLDAFVITDDGVSYVSDDFDVFADSIKIKIENEIASAIPVPAAVWLFGSALLGLVARARVTRTRVKSTAT